MILPPGIDPTDEIKILWKRTRKRTVVTATLGGAEVIVRCKPESAETLPWLVASLPNIMEAAYAALEKEEA